jgi:hypothetical protein
MSIWPEAKKSDFDWSSCLKWCAGAGLALALAALLFNVLVDPYGSNPLRIRFERPLMDINQRFMFPQVLRSGDFDSAVFGTSTSRLLSPADLESSFGGHFANFGMNAATPFEQNEAVRLYLAHAPQLRTLIWGLDEHWCEEDVDAPAKRLTERAFPPWLYGGSAWASIPHLFNLRTLEIASRLVLNRLGLMKQRLPRDGYEVFTPPEASYDLARARRYIAIARQSMGHGDAAHPIAVASPIFEASAAERSSWRYPALDWLAATLAELPKGARLILLFPPAHEAALPLSGSYDEAREAECKRRLAVIARARQGILVDFRFPSPITSEDDYFWDTLHYRLPIARRIVGALRQAADGGSGSDFKVIAAAP